MTDYRKSRSGRLEKSFQLSPEEISQIKTLWQGNPKNSGWRFICPLCKLQRQVPLHPRPQPRHYAQILITSAFFSLVTWPFFEWKGLVSFIPFWCLFEVIYRTRARAALYCKNCGFDPYLFLIDSDLAKKEVETHWRKKFEAKGIPYPEAKGRVSSKSQKIPPPPPQRASDALKTNPTPPPRPTVGPQKGIS